MQTVLEKLEAGGDRGPASDQRRNSWARWLAAPLAVFVALIGWLVMASRPGTDQAGHNDVRAGGLALTVSQMLWMSNDMGDGPVAVPTGFPMPGDMMPGMQSAGDDRLRVEVNLSNVSSHVQRYAQTDFEVVAPGGKSWKSFTGANHDVISAGVLQPGFNVTVDVYFDVPAQQSGNLTVRWSRGGNTVLFPVKIGIPSPHVH